MFNSCRGLAALGLRMPVFPFSIAYQLRRPALGNQTAGAITPASFPLTREKAVNSSRAFLAKANLSGQLGENGRVYSAGRRDGRTCKQDPGREIQLLHFCTSDLRRPGFEVESTFLSSFNAPE